MQLQLINKNGLKYKLRFLSATVKITIQNENYAFNNKLDFVEISEKFSAKINFQPASSAPTDTVYIPDNGFTYGVRENGLTYEWNRDNTANMRDRMADVDIVLQRLAHLQLGGDYA